ncbi:2-succinyl-5-enolpyruvyl-6-hydroxy-3-cyclohexene-1-carboxylic-acid synthase [Candidatus Viridilinea mediisalina]|uniref:2-succinyl-5-enolpyruvyl-6-hydroxy-3-cyclohexene-1-carboxylate synthase n=1 Tax=Candidatus Viridilinea mediisalina TaxID=2024553 RepID=A0A2A6RDN6_9CHLR|nr:2-succinyl-5-enolpyruvyl-6-hydroxy-3-cyclohexene-1-carboxylic-acid synthase [Candidatus Viridilinea mediisalina]PDV99627.1 2-succinyl-5-enolpyruvyl-6-hydroxy-3-cyclohexene-1-carboxylic-acid synthase [Candidatus Viridilinea mediisalina]
MHNHTETLTHWVATLVQQIIAGGIHDFVVCPGSRSTPIALAVARHPEAQVRVLLDERSAGFFALGLAKQSGRPAALICTSGTATTNFLPAVAEADLARVPLLLLTADRPPELRDNGAPQTINQMSIFGPRPRWFSDLPCPDASPGLLNYLKAVVARAIAACMAPPAGPVHLNLPFREPLLPDRELLLQLFERGAAASKLQVKHSPRQAHSAIVAALAARMASVERGLIICGPNCPPGLAAVVAPLAERIGFPILADPLSGVRCGSPSLTLVCGSYDAFLRTEAFASHAPELVLRFGAMPTSKPVLLYLQRHPSAHQIVVDEGAGWREPTNLAAEHLAADPLELCVALNAHLGSQAPLQRPWTNLWRNAEQVSRQILHETLVNQTHISEPGVFARLAPLLPEGATLFVANSMPIRDCDSFFPAMERSVAIAGNRGANGIDGLVSTALGMAAAGAKPLLMVLGDLSLYHDANGLLAATLCHLDATIVLINNDGGGIFSFLPSASETDQFEPLFGTPHGLDFGPLAQLYKAHYTLAQDWPSFEAAVRAGLEGRGLHLIEVRTERQQNVADHRALWPLLEIVDCRL